MANARRVKYLYRVTSEHADGRTWTRHYQDIRSAYGRAARERELNAETVTIERSNLITWLGDDR
jgi:hypothetical protein